MQQIFGGLGYLLGWILWGAFYVVKDFGIAIVIFTVIVKLCIFPMTIKQQKSMAGTARLNKKQKEIQEKYANNKQKAQEEIQKLYEKEGVKPMGGCLTMLIPMLVLFGVFYAVGWPLTNTLHLNSDAVNDAVSYMSTIPGFSAQTGMYNYQEINLITIFPNIADTAKIQELFSTSEIRQILELHSGFTMFGVIDLLTIPQSKGFISFYTLIPVLCFASNIGSQLVMQKINKNQTQQQGCMRVMLFALPLFSAYIAYVVPSAMGFYWFISALFSLVQSVVMGKIFGPAQLTANAEARHAALLFENESKVLRVYAPKDSAGQKKDKNKDKKKR